MTVTVHFLVPLVGCWLVVCFTTCIAADDGFLERVTEDKAPPVVLESLDDTAAGARPSVMVGVCSFMRAIGEYHSARR